MDQSYGNTLIVCAIGAIATTALVWASFQYFAYADAQREEAWTAYTECVQREYGTTPVAWYAEHGEAPDCNY